MRVKGSQCLLYEVQVLFTRGRIVH